MKIKNTILLISIIVFGWTVTTETTPFTSETSLDDYFNLYGGKENFQQHYADALTTMITAEDLVKAKKYQAAKKALDKLWEQYPIGKNNWWNTKTDDKKNKTNIGNPGAYSALRMLTDIVDHHLNAATQESPKGVVTATLRVVLVGCSEGIKPSTTTEMSKGIGENTKKTLDARLKADNHRIIAQSLDLFLQYVNAITDGQLKIEVKYYDLENYCASTQVLKDGRHAGLKNYGEVLNQVPQNIKQETDWWWILYPSTVPEDGVNGIAKKAGFDDRHEFITGGMGRYGQNKPVFIIDDRWLVRHPPHLGRGNMTDIERRAYLPQWLQHEFFHHLYGIYPDLKLEVKGHDWFDRNFWARDFTGTFEADYYHETLYKRLKTAKPFLHYLLKPTYQPSVSDLNTLEMEQFLNKTYDASEIVKKRGTTPNDWHVAQIIKENDKYYWKNKANVQWEVIPDFKNSTFKTKADNPYKGNDFYIGFKRSETGGFTNIIEGLHFNGTLYQLSDNGVKTLDINQLLNKTYDASEAVKKRGIAINDWHIAQIIEENNKYYWRNKANVQWEVVPDFKNATLRTKDDNPYKGHDFDIVFKKNNAGEVTNIIEGLDFNGTLYKLK